MIKSILISMRPRQWAKNILLFAGLIFSENLFYLDKLARATLGFIVFCALSGALYILNDLKDKDQDRIHPLKSRRPIASGLLPEKIAFFTALGILIIFIPIGFVPNINFGVIALSYVIMMLLYTRFFKHVVILDLLILAFGFVLRAAGGVQVIRVESESIETTAWFIACTLFLALFLAICKRRHEVITLDDRGINHRRVLEEYSVPFLDQMVNITTSATIITYALYTIQHDMMILTVPFVLYGILRYLYLVYRRGEGGAPEMLLFNDRPLQINLILWVIACAVFLYQFD